MMIYVPQVVATAPPLSLDGLGSTPSGWWLRHGSKSQLLNTTRGNDVVILIVEAVYSKASVTSIIDSKGLKFAPRLSYASQSFEARLSEFYARTTSPLESDNITAICDCLPFGGMQAVAIHGANSREIFDPNPLIPLTESCSFIASSPCGACEAGVGSTGACSGTIQTSTFDFVIVSTAISDAGACGGTYARSGGVPGFTTIVSPSFRSSTFSSIFEVDYTITTAPHDTVVFSCSNTDAVAIVADAVSFQGAFGF